MRNYVLWQSVLLFLLAFSLTVVLEMRLIPWLRRHRAGQPILEIGPAWHKTKAGTPTLGGLGFILASGISVAVLAVCNARAGLGVWNELSLLFCFALCCGAIGFFDDWCKLKKRENQGLTAWQKYALQLLVSGVFLLVLQRSFGISTVVSLPFSDFELKLGYVYYPLALLYLTGLINALNLTDGLDGLLTSAMGVFALFLLGWGAIAGGSLPLNAGALLLGITVGFLCFNRYPAKVFMGDTGSLFLGAMLAGYGLLTSPITVLIAGGVFVVEAASVILQVLYFKLTHGKRLFRMAPLHHHFEKLGWSEIRVVRLFVTVSAMLALVALAGEVLR